MAAASAPSVTPPSKDVPVELVDRAVKALLKWKGAKSEDNKPQLLTSDEFLMLVVTLKKIPDGRTNPYKLPLIHPLYSTSTDGFSAPEFCLFVDDRPGRKPTSQDAKEKIAAENIPISKVIKFSKLKSDYKPFEAKRKLCNSYDLFLTDRRIVPLLPRALGKYFFRKKLIPVTMDLTHQNWKEQVERICGSARMFLKTGTCSSIRVARSSMTREQIVENVMAAINGVAETVPRKWKNIRALHLKFTESLALPIYQSVPEMNLSVSGLVKNEALVEQKKRLREEEGDKVSVKKQKKNVAKKGRIHEVRYMDGEVDGLLGGDEEDNDVLEEEMSGEDNDALEEMSDDDNNETEEVVKPVKKKGSKDLKQKMGDSVKVSKKKAGVVGKAKIGKEKVSKDLKQKKGAAVEVSKKKTEVVGEAEEKATKILKKTSAVKKVKTKKLRN